MLNWVKKLFSGNEADKAETDLLTGLFNKDAVGQYIEGYLEGTGRNTQCMLFFIDLDDFGKINDAMGHAFGDEVLSTLGRMLKEAFPQNSILGRIEGDRFVLFLEALPDNNTMSTESGRLLELFRNFRAGEYIKYSVTASIGASFYPQNGTDFEELLKAADRAAYQAKRSGKNRLVLYGQELAGEEIDIT